MINIFIRRKVQMRTLGMTGVAHLANQAAAHRLSGSSYPLTYRHKSLRQVGIPNGDVMNPIVNYDIVSVTTVVMAIVVT